MDIKNKCWGHHCSEYADALKFWEKIKGITSDYRKEKVVLTFNHLLLLLDLDVTTPTHWSTCKPDNLKVLAKARMICDETIYYAINRDPKQLFEYWKLTRQGGLDEVKENKEQKLDVSAFIDTGPAGEVFDEPNLGDKGNNKKGNN